MYREDILQLYHRKQKGLYIRNNEKQFILFPLKIMVLHWLCGALEMYQNKMLSSQCAICVGVICMFSLEQRLYAQKEDLLLDFF